VGTSRGRVGRTGGVLVTGGVQADLCIRDWQEGVDEGVVNWRPTWGLRSKFHLTNQPRVDTLCVSVDGELMAPASEDGATRWIYGFDTNSVNFAPRFVPGPGQALTMEYEAEPP